MERSIQRDLCWKIRQISSRVPGRDSDLKLGGSFNMSAYFIGFRSNVDTIHGFTMALLGPNSHKAGSYVQLAKRWTPISLETMRIYLFSLRDLNFWA